MPTGRLGPACKILPAVKGFAGGPVERPEHPWFVFSYSCVAKAIGPWIVLRCRETTMRRVLLAATVLAIPALLVAQIAETPFRYDGYGYAFFTVGKCQHRYLNVGAGGGGEGFLWRGLTLGAEVGYYDFPSDRAGGYGAVMLNTGYHFVDRKKPKKLDPYVSVTVLGLAVAPGGRAGSGNLGGGVNYWFNRRLGIQAAANIQVVGREGVILFRVGPTFR